MGARVEGKKKRKSAIKTKVTSKFGAKRLLSRMGKKVKKGEAGPSTEFITRSSALKKLQITLKDFRRLCILKGIYPRVPVKAPKGSDKVYYDIKDISYLSHEPLLDKFREFKSFMKKIRRASGRKQFDEARRRDEMKPIMAMDHLVKERYPRFIDALRDMDDALCMVHLFASMPSEGRITATHSTLCADLVRHWQFYIAKSRSLHKVFVSVKGVYFQAEVMGEAITWLTPHPFTQTIPREVDVRVMITFLEFYEVFLKFVLFKLYHSQGLRYPPVEDQCMKDAGCFLLAVKPIPLDAALVAGGSTAVVVTADVSNSSEAINNKNKSSSSSSSSSSSAASSSASANANNKESAARLATLNKKLACLAGSTLDDDDEEEAGEALTLPLADAFSSLSGPDSGYQDPEEIRAFSRPQGEGGIGDVTGTSKTAGDTRSRLFANLKVFVNREVPLQWMQLCLLSLGAQVGWDGPSSPFPVSDDGITHQIVDRPLPAQGQGLNARRELVQPQWIFDSVNAQLLLPVSKYRPGMPLPPHLSPFVDDDVEGYTPKYRQEVLQLQASSASLATGTAPPVAEKEELDEGDDDDDEEEEEEEEEERYQRELAAEKRGKSYSKSQAKKEEEDEEEEDEDDEEEEEEEEKPKASVDLSGKKGPKGVVHRPAAHTDSEESLAQIMMSKKTKRLYGRMQHGIEQKKEAVGRLETKRKALEEASKPLPPSKAGKGKPVEKGSDKNNKGGKKGAEVVEPSTKKARKR